MSSLVCNMRPGAAMTRMLGIATPNRPTMRFGEALDTVLVTDGLKAMIGAAFKACLTTDGRLDTKDVAHFVMTRMGVFQAPTAGVDQLKAQIDDANKVMAFAGLLTEAIEKRQQKDGTLDLSDVAAHVFAAMRSHQK